MTDHDKTWHEFRDAVNMPPKKLGEWLDTDESKQVGQKSSEGSEVTSIVI